MYMRKVVSFTASVLVTLLSLLLFGMVSTSQSATTGSVITVEGSETMVNNTVEDPVNTVTVMRDCAVGVLNPTCNNSVLYGCKPGNPVNKDQDGTKYYWQCKEQCITKTGDTREKIGGVCNFKKPQCSSGRYACKGGVGTIVDKSSVRVETESSGLHQSILRSSWLCERLIGPNVGEVITSNRCVRKIPRKGVCGPYENGAGTCEEGDPHDNIVDSETHYKWACLSPDSGNTAVMDGQDGVGANGLIYYGEDYATTFCEAAKTPACDTSGRTPACDPGTVKILDDTSKLTTTFICTSDGKSTDTCTVHKAPQCGGSGGFVACVRGVAEKVNRALCGNIRPNQSCYICKNLIGETDGPCPGIETSSDVEPPKDAREGVLKFEEEIGPACTSSVDRLGTVVPEFFEHCIVGEEVLGDRYIETDCRMGTIHQDDAVFYVRRKGGDLSKKLTVNLDCGYVEVDSRDSDENPVSTDIFDSSFSSTLRSVRSVRVDLLPNQSFVSFLVPRLVSNVAIPQNTAIRCTIDKGGLDSTYIADPDALTDFVEISGPALLGNPAFANVLKVVMDKYKVPRAEESDLRTHISAASVFFTYLWGHYAGFIRMPRYSIQGLLTAPQISISGGADEEVVETQRKNEIDLRRYRLLAGLFTPEYDPRFVEKHYGFLTPDEAREEYENSHANRFRDDLGTALANFMFKVPDAYR